MGKNNAKTNIIVSMSCIILSSSIFMACNKKNTGVDNNQISQKNTDKTVVSGRFVFSSKESLSETIDQFYAEKIELVEDNFEKLYEKGFRSHTPLVNSENEQLINLFSEEYKLKTNLLKYSNGTDEEGEFITDPFLAALVNENNVIIVNDTIYKFTKGNGIFFAHIKDTTYLFDYIKKELTSKENFKMSSVYADPCEMRVELGGVTQIDDKISRFISPDECYVNDGGSSEGNPPPTTAPTLQEIINGLPICEGNSGNWIDGLFGKSYDCTSYFDDRTRIKIEFWDQKWLIYASVGVLAKTQTKTLGIWWASVSDEIYLGINRVLLKYNYPAPVIKAPPLSSYFSTLDKIPLYLYNGTFIIKDYRGSNSYVEAAINVTKNTLPFWDFENRNMLNIYVPGDDNDIHLNSSELITSPDNIKKLYKLGIDFFKAQFGSGENTEFVVSYQKTPTVIEVLYFGEHYSATNENKIKHKFHSEVAFEIKATIGIGNGEFKPDFSLETVPASFRSYTYYELDFYGMAKRGNVYKGARMIR